MLAGRPILRFLGMLALSFLVAGMMLMARTRLITPQRGVADGTDDDASFDYWWPEFSTRDNESTVNVKVRGKMKVLARLPSRVGENFTSLVEAAISNTPSDAIRHPRKLLYRAANEGWGYSVDIKSQLERVQVTLWGTDWIDKGLVPLSGCPVRKRPVTLSTATFAAATRTAGDSVMLACPLHPYCTMVYSEDPDVFRRSHVVVIPSTQSVRDVLPKNVNKPRGVVVPRQFRVLYRREALWELGDAKQVIANQYDLEMGFRATGGMLNPIFPEPPREIGMLNDKGVASLKLEDRPEFAMSLISDCKTQSRRERYLKRLKDILGAERVHEYGDCGDGKHRLAKHQFGALIKYKFYFAFENTIAHGYVTEKLYDRLKFGPLLVYLGDPTAPNITVTPSYINVARDFSSPEALAAYLVWLSENEEEYMKYHAWRALPPSEAFEPHYLEMVARHVPGEAEMAIYSGKLSRMTVGPNRRAACCRLCNLAYLKERAEREDWSQFNSPRGWEWISKNLWGGGGRSSNGTL